MSNNAFGINLLSLTLELLQFIGSPFETKTKKLNQAKLFDLYRYSNKNRMLFLYLETLKEKGSLSHLNRIYEKEKARQQETLKAISMVSKVLSDSNIDHAVFKTVRPYKFTTVDIDVLIFGCKSIYLKATNSMLKAGYKMLVEGPESTTLSDPKTSLGVDLYNDVAVSYVSYMDKATLLDFAADVKLPNGDCVRALKPEADLAAIIAHSVIKEQMYTLSEYYTFIHYLTQMNLSNFLQIVKQNKISIATKIHASITGYLHQIAHCSVPNKLQQILSLLGEEKFELPSLLQENFKTPHKYHILTVARSLLELSGRKDAQESIARQLLNMINPVFAREFLQRFSNHITRETY